VHRRASPSPYPSLLPWLTLGWNCHKCWYCTGPPRTAPPLFLFCVPPPVPFMPMPPRCPPLACAPKQGAASRVASQQAPEATPSAPASRPPSLPRQCRLAATPAPAPVSDSAPAPAPAPAPGLGPRQGWRALCWRQQCGSALPEVAREGRSEVRSAEAQLPCGGPQKRVSAPLQALQKLLGKLPIPAAAARLFRPPPPRGIVPGSGLSLSQKRACTPLPLPLPLPHLPALPLPAPPAAPAAPAPACRPSCHPSGPAARACRAASCCPHPWKAPGGD